jgi:hypothetical protein
MVYSPEIQFQKFSIYDRKAYFDKRIYPALPTRNFRKNLLRSQDSIFLPENIKYITSPEFLYMHILRKYENISILRGLPVINHMSTNYNSWQFLGDICMCMKEIPLASLFFKAASIDEPKNPYFACLVDYIKKRYQQKVNCPEVDRSNKKPNLFSRENPPKKVSEVFLNNLRSKYNPSVVEKIQTEYTSLNQICERVRFASFPCPFYISGCSKCNMEEKCTYGQLYPILIQLSNDFPDKLEFEYE